MPFYKKSYNKQQKVYYTRVLVDSDELEWIELSPETKDTAPSGKDGNGNMEENPLG